MLFAGGAIPSQGSEDYTVLKLRITDFNGLEELGCRHFGSVKAVNLQRSKYKAKFVDRR